MKLPLDLLPMALCGLATIVAVAVILVVSDLLRRVVLLVIARFERSRVPATPPRVEPAADATPNTARNETIPG